MNIRVINVDGTYTWVNVDNIIKKTLTIDEVKQLKINEIDISCKNAILGGFYSTAYQGIDKIYDSSMESQNNILGNTVSSISKLAGIIGCESDRFYYHAKDEIDFQEWQSSECLQLARDWKTFKEITLFKEKQLIIYVMGLTDINLIDLVNWDMVIPS